MTVSQNLLRCNALARGNSMNGDGRPPKSADLQGIKIKMRERIKESQ